MPAPFLGLALRDGAIMAVAGAALIMGALRANPRLFMRHFPEAVKARLAPLSDREKRAGSVVGAALMVLLLGGPLASVLLAPPQPLTAAVLHAFTVGMVFNLVDWLVLDELWLGVLQPQWALPAGTSKDDFRPWDHARHFRGFATGTVLCAVFAVVAAGLDALLR